MGQPSNHLQALLGNKGNSGAQELVQHLIQWLLDQCRSLECLQPGALGGRWKTWYFGVGFWAVQYLNMDPVALLIIDPVDLVVDHVRKHKTSPAALSCLSAGCSRSREAVTGSGSIHSMLEHARLQ